MGEKNKIKLSIAVLFNTALFIVISLIAISCSSRKELMTEPLFRQSKRISIDLPEEGVMVDSVTGAIIATETVTYKNEERGEYYNMDSIGNTPAKADEVIDMTKSLHRLRAVAVTAKSRFAPEREGYIGTGFTIRVPKELLSSYWSVVIEPILMHNDSLVPLRKVVLRGQDFAYKQKESYSKYREFLKTLVGKPDYDEYFLDKRNIEKDIKRKQKNNFDQYYNLWNKRVKFEKWKFDREDQDAFYYAKRMGFNFKKYSEYSLKSFMEADIEERKGKLSVGLNEKYRKEYEKKTKGFPSLFVQEEMKEKVVPRRYRQTFKDNVKAKDITNKYITDADLKQIAENRYFWDDIAYNEVLVERRQSIFKSMVKHPYFDPETVFLDSIVEGTEDFVFYYPHQYPVFEGLKNVRVTLKSQIRAIDQSTYRTGQTDTLTYIVSSLSQLMDTTFAAREAAIYSNVREFATMYVEFPVNKNDFDINYTVNRGEVGKFTDTYAKVSKEGFVIDNIDLSGTVSLEGPAVENEQKNAKRLESLRRYLTYKHPELGRYITLTNKGEDVSRAIELIGESFFVKNKEIIVERLKTAENVDVAEEAIKETYKEDYAYIRDFIYPRLRKVEVVFSLHRDRSGKNQEIAEQMMLEYEGALKLLEERKYTAALNILEHYSDYNTALALVCLGYNSRAYEVLRSLNPTADSEYLLAIVMYRLKNERRAVEHLLKACEMDYNKVARTNLDSETKMLVLKYGLQERLSQIEDKYLNAIELPEVDKPAE